MTVWCLLTFKCRTKQNKGCPRKQEELCCQPVPAAAADSLGTILKAEMGGVGKWGGPFVSRLVVGLEIIENIEYCRKSSNFLIKMTLTYKFSI